MSKILLGFGYLTWIVCNLAIIYGIGWGAIKLLESESVGEFILHLAFGMFMLFLVVILSILCLGLVAIIFGDDKLEKKLNDLFPDK